MPASKTGSVVPNLNWNRRAGSRGVTLRPWLQIFSGDGGAGHAYRGTCKRRGGGNARHPAVMRGFDPSYLAHSVRVTVVECLVPFWST
jgi:hypothetical protein